MVADGNLIANYAVFASRYEDFQERVSVVGVEPLFQDAYWITNALIRYGSPTETWSVSAGFKNIAD